MSSTYVPLARKWRPRTFADVVGQEEIVRALTNAVSQDRLAHAYLFSGQRGVGKTTTARLLAAAINCSSFDAPTTTPCGTCSSCVEIFEGRSIDAHEIDGATHGKVDQARELIEVVAYAPVRDRRKVFIIDEVHAISQAAFQALLKTLEEPPPHVVFILATTERHKIPATILSRCQRFEFRRLTDEEVADRLADVARREGFVVEGDGEAPEPRPHAPHVEWPALAALAAAATGSLRDALSLFDQAMARAGESAEGGARVTAADVAALLGAPDRSALVALLSAILSGDRAGVLRSSAELDASASDPRTALSDLTTLVRGAVRIAADPSSAAPLGLSEEASARLAEFGRLTPYPTLLRLLSMLVDSRELMRRSDVPSLALEVTLLKLAELPRLVEIEDLLSGRSSFAAGPASAAAATQGPTAARVPQASSAPARAAAAPRSAREVGGRAPEPPSQPAAAEAPRFVGLTKLEAEPDPIPADERAGAFRAAVEKRHNQLGAVLEDTSIQIEGKKVRIVIDPPDVVAEKRLVEPGVSKVLNEAAEAVLGRGASVHVVSVPPAGGNLTVAAAAADPAALERDLLKQRVASDERVKKLLSLFDGEIAEVKRSEGDS